MDTNRGTNIALALAALLAAGGCGGTSNTDPTDAVEGAAVIKCEGGNACKGQSECATADGKSSCAGENACRGTGYVFTQTEPECTALQLKNHG